MMKDDHIESAANPILAEAPTTAYDSSKPIVAKDNFVLAHKNLVPGVYKLIQQQQEDEIMMGKSKEVDEWLLGSAESNLTGVGQTQDTTQQCQKPKQMKMEPVEEQKGESEEDTWMFRTFSRVPKPQAVEEPMHQTQLIEQDVQFEDDGEFDCMGSGDLMQFISQM